MRLPFLTIAVALIFAGPAFAQRSLFDQPVDAAPAMPVQQRPSAAAPTPAAQPAPAPQGEVLPTKKPPKAARAKPRGPVPARSLSILNGTPQALVDLEVSQGGKAARLKKPVAPGKKGMLALPAFKSCEVTVASTFEGSPPNDAMPIDICKEKALNFKD